MNRIELRIPVDEYEGFNARVMRHWMHGGEPVLSHHTRMSGGVNEFASFTSDHIADINYVLSILPKGSAALGTDGWVSCRPWAINTVMSRVTREISGWVRLWLHRYFCWVNEIA